MWLCVLVPRALARVAARLRGRDLAGTDDAVKRVVAFEVVDGQLVGVVLSERLGGRLACGQEDPLDLACLRVGHVVRAVGDDEVTVGRPEDQIDVAVIVLDGVEAAEQRSLVADLVAAGVDLVEAVEQHHDETDGVQAGAEGRKAVVIRELKRPEDAEDGEDANRKQPPVPVLPEHAQNERGDGGYAEDDRTEVVDEVDPELASLLLAALALLIIDRRLLPAGRHVGSRRYSHNFPAFLRRAGHGLYLLYNKTVISTMRAYQGMQRVRAE